MVQLQFRITLTKKKLRITMDTLRRKDASPDELLIAEGMEEMYIGMMKRITGMKVTVTEKKHKKEREG